MEPPMSVSTLRTVTTMNASPVPSPPKIANSEPVNVCEGDAIHG